MNNKFMRRFSYHEWLMIGIAVTPVVVILVIIGYLIGLIL
jgi:hypothetical protein